MPEKTIGYYKWLYRQRKQKRARKRAKHREIRAWTKMNPPTEPQIYDLFEERAQIIWNSDGSFMCEGVHFCGCGDQLMNSEDQARGKCDICKMFNEINNKPCSPLDLRDPNRIDQILNKIKEVWNKHPQQRLGQLLYNYFNFQRDNLAHQPDSNFEIKEWIGIKTKADQTKYFKKKFSKKPTHYAEFELSEKITKRPTQEEINNSRVCEDCPYWIEELDVWNIGCCGLVPQDHTSDDLVCPISDEEFFGVR